jgi:hypothetical protein
MKGRYVIDTDELLLKSISDGVTTDKDVLRKAIKIKMLKELIKDEGVTINKSFALLGVLSNE